MSLSRRDAIKIGLGVGATALVGYGRPTALMGSRPVFTQTGELITKPIPSSGERIPVVGIGTARRYSVGEGTAERAPLKEVLAALAEAHEELGPSRLTINGYEAWRFRQIARDQDARNRLPRARTIRRRFGSWKAAVAKLGSRKEHGER